MKITIARHWQLVLIIPLLLAACGGGGTDSEGFTNPTATFEAGAATVNITAPPNGSIIYAEAIRISGDLLGSPQVFSIHLFTPDEQVIAETSVDAQPGEWQVELVHGYAGTPTEVEVVAASADGTVFDTSTVLLSDVSNRPDGSFATIDLPLDGDTVGGDTIPIQGRASGIEGGQLTLQLVDSANSVIDSETINLLNAFVIDDVPWQADLERGDATGSATIRLLSADESNEFNRVAVTLSEAAG